MTQHKLLVFNRQQSGTRPPARRGRLRPRGEEAAGGRLQAHGAAHS